ncbi:MAG: ABC transporter ATP-binding protein [Candidatus Marinimicrobia bacterium]|nr:ABC transporter ATP-binding protein [Candidatus Neomarinimicrobiota bacterium]
MSLIKKITTIKKEEIVIVKQKSIDYILGMITGISIMIAVWACTSGNPVIAASSEVQDVRIVNEKWYPVYVEVID